MIVGTGKRPAPRQLESRRVAIGLMPGKYPRQSPITDEEGLPSVDIKQEEGAEKDDRDSLEDQGSCDIPHEEEGVVVPEAEVAAGFMMLRNQRDRILLNQLGVGSYATYDPGAPRQWPRRRALPPAVVRHAPLPLHSYVPPTTIARESLNEQELLQTAHPNGSLLPFAPSPAAINITPYSRSDPQLEPQSYGAIVPYVHPSVSSTPTSDPLGNRVRIRQNKFPQRQLEPPTSHVDMSDPVTQYPPGQLAMPRLHHNSHIGYNDRLGLAFHPPLLIDFNRCSKTGQGSAPIPAQRMGYSVSGHPSWPVPDNLLPTPPSFEASAWERHSSTRENTPRTTPTNIQASIWENYSTRANTSRINPNTTASSWEASDPTTPELPNQEKYTQPNHLTLAIASQSGPSESSRLRDYVVPRDLATKPRLPSAADGSSLPPESTNPGLPRTTASLLQLPSAQGNSDRPPPFELSASATPFGLPYPPTDRIADRTQENYNVSSFISAASEVTGPTVPPRRHNTGLLQDPRGIEPIKLTEAHVSDCESHADHSLPEAHTNQPSTNVRSDTMLMQAQQLATGDIIEDTRGTRIPRLVPATDPVYGGIRPTMAGVVETRPNQELFRPKPENPFWAKEIRDRNYREAPGTEGYGARKLSLRGGESPDYRAMVPLRSPWKRNPIIASTFHHIRATAKTIYPEGKPVGIEHPKAPLVPSPHSDLTPLTQEVVREAKDPHGGISFGWKITEPTFEFSAEPTVALNPGQQTPPLILSTTSAQNLPGGVTDVEETGISQAIPTSPPLPSRERRILFPPLGSSGLPTPPPSWRIPNYQGLSRIPIPRGGGTYRSHLPLQRWDGSSSTRPSIPLKPPSRPPTPPKTPPLISTPTIQKLHQPAVPEDLSSSLQAEDSFFGDLPVSEVHKLEPGLAKIHTRKFRKRLREESLRVWILRQCYLAKVNEAYGGVIFEKEEVSREGLMDLEVLVEDEGSFI